MSRRLSPEAEQYRVDCLRSEMPPYDDKWCCCGEWFDYWTETTPVAPGPHIVRTKGCKYEGAGRDAERSAGKGRRPVTEAGPRGVVTPPVARCEERRIFTARAVRRCIRKTGHDGEHWFRGERIGTGWPVPVTEETR